MKAYSNKAFISKAIKNSKSERKRQIAKYNAAKSAKADVKIGDVICKL